MYVGNIEKTKSTTTACMISSHDGPSLPRRTLENASGVFRKYINYNTVQSKSHAVMDNRDDIKIHCTFFHLPRCRSFVAS